MGPRDHSVNSHIHLHLDILWSKVVSTTFLDLLGLDPNASPLKSLTSQLGPIPEPGSCLEQIPSQTAGSGEPSCVQFHGSSGFCPSAGYYWCCPPPLCVCDGGQGPFWVACQLAVSTQTRLMRLSAMSHLPDRDQLSNLVSSRSDVEPVGVHVPSH